MGLFIFLAMAFLMITASIEGQKGQRKGSRNRSRRRYHNKNRRRQDQMNRQLQQWAMEESRKSVTPFEMGGYDLTQGNSFNNQNMF